MDLFDYLRELPMSQFLPLEKLYQREVEELTKRKFKLILEQQFKLGTLTEIHSGLADVIHKNDEQLKIKLAKEHHNGWLWITISPKPEISFAEFRKKVDKLVNRKMFKSAEWAFEQRSSDPNQFYGFHAHILAQRCLSYKPSKCKRGIKNTCKGLVGSVDNNNVLNIQIIGDDYAIDKAQYFKGIKTGAGKEEKQLVDKIWRVKEGLLPYYTRN